LTEASESSQSDPAEKTSITDATYAKPFPVTPLARASLLNTCRVPWLRLRETRGGSRLLRPWRWDGAVRGGAILTAEFTERPGSLPRPLVLRVSTKDPPHRGGRGAVVHTHHPAPPQENVRTTLPARTRGTTAPTSKACERDRETPLGGAPQPAHHARTRIGRIV
jgi:hypothetical protein